MMITIIYNQNTNLQFLSIKEYSLISRNLWRRTILYLFTKIYYFLINQVLFVYIFLLSETVLIPYYGIK